MLEFFTGIIHVLCVWVGVCVYSANVFVYAAHSLCITEFVIIEIETDVGGFIWFLYTHSAITTTSGECVYNTHSNWLSPGREIPTRKCVYWTRRTGFILSFSPLAYSPFPPPLSLSLCIHRMHCITITQINLVSPFSLLASPPPLIRPRPFIVLLTFRCLFVIFPYISRQMPKSSYSRSSYVVQADVEMNTTYSVRMFAAIDRCCGVYLLTRRVDSGKVGGRTVGWFLYISTSLCELFCAMKYA